MELVGDVGKADCERFGLLHDVVEDQRAPEALLCRRLHQCGLQGCHAGAADLVGAGLGAQERGVGIHQQGSVNVGIQREVVHTQHPRHCCRRKR